MKEEKARRELINAKIVEVHVIPDDNLIGLTVEKNGKRRKLCIESDWYASLEFEEEE